MKLAGAYERLGKIDLAAEEYNLALSKTGSNDDILMSLENIWQQKIIDNPQDAEAHANLGAVLQKKKDYQGALAQYKKAESINPSNTNTASRRSAESAAYSIRSSSRFSAVT